jgi:hypothetical protein
MMDCSIWYPIIASWPSFFIGHAFMHLTDKMVSSIANGLFRQWFISWKTSAAVSSACMHVLHMVPWSGVYGVNVNATMMSVGICGSGPIGHIICNCVYKQ